MHQSSLRALVAVTLENYNDININNDITIIKCNDNVKDYPSVPKHFVCKSLEELLILARSRRMMHGRWSCNVSSTNFKECYNKLKKLCITGCFDKYVIIQKDYNGSYLISVTTNDFDNIEDVYKIGLIFKSCVNTEILYRPYIILVSNLYDAYIYKM